MKFLLAVFLFSPICTAGTITLSLLSVSNFKAEHAAALAPYGVTTDRGFVIAAGSNPNAIAEVLQIPQHDVEPLLRLVVMMAGGEWISKWAGQCQTLITSKALLARGFNRTPILAIPGIPLDKIPGLVKEKRIASAEAFYASYLLDAASLQNALEVEQATLLSYVELIVRYAPHVAAALERSRARGRAEIELRTYLAP